MDKKSILIVTDWLYPYLNANSEIAYRIAYFLHDSFNIKISILGFNPVSELSFPRIRVGFDHISVVALERLDQIVKSNPKKINRICKIAIDSSCRRYYLNCKLGRRNALGIEYKHALNSLLKKQKYDCLIGFMNPKASLFALSHIIKEIPFVAYKLDPWSSHYNIKQKELAQQDERKADLKAAAIITTDLIRKDYPKTTPVEILNKISVLNFPNVIDFKSLNDQRFISQPKEIHCVFAGGLYKDIRNPEYTLKLFARLKDSKIVFHIFGKQYGSENMLETLSENVTWHGRVTSDEALGYMQSADVLVNIGNTVLNQMPSKILTYISLGKPILNIIKDPNCPTLPYMEKYPLALNILETPEPTKEDIARVRDFILTNRGKHIPFETIKELYYDCTPEYVGGKVYEIICKVVEESKRSKNK